MKFHEFLVSRRVKFNIERCELARQANIPEKLVEHIEHGIQIPKDLLVLKKLADTLHLDHEWFLNFANIKTLLTYTGRRTWNFDTHNS